MKFNFQPQEEYLEWIPEGKKIISDYDLCGNVSYRKFKDDEKLDERQDKLRKHLGNDILQEDIDRQRDLYYNQGFNISSICLKPKGHSGKCSSQPYSFDKTNPIARGFRQKINAGIENDGGDSGAMNRAGPRWWPIQATKEIHQAVKASLKRIGAKTKDGNIYVHQNLASGPYMGTLSSFDMMAQCSQVEEFGNYLKLEPGMRPILDRRYLDLVKSWRSIIPVPVQKNGVPCDPLTQEIIKADHFGKGSSDLSGAQFGHISPKKFDKYATRPYNVILQNRHGNSMQTNDSIANTVEKFGQVWNARFEK